MAPKKNIYVIYAGQDKNLAHKLIQRWQLFEKEFNVSIWYDNPIHPQEPWKPRNTERLNRADVFLLLVSHAFMYSPFIQQDEFKTVIDKYKTGESTVIPILLNACPWDVEFNSDDYDFSFKELQVLPNNKVPVSDWDSEEEALKHITEGVRNTIAPISETVETKDKAADFTGIKEVKAAPKEQVKVNLTDKGEVKEKEGTNEVLKLEKEAERQLELQEAEVLKRIEKKKMAEQRLEAERKTQEITKRDEERKRIAEKNEADKKGNEEKSSIEAAAQKRADEERERKRAAVVGKEKLEERTALKARAKEKALAEKMPEPVSEAQQITEESRLSEEAGPRNMVEENDRERQYVNSLDTSEEYDTSSEVPKMSKSSLKNKIILGSVVAIVLIGIIWVFNSGSEETSPVLSNPEVTDINDEKTSEASKTEPVEANETPTKLKVGSRYEGGIIFTLDESGQTGTLASYDDEGPMPYSEAIAIQDKLGDGWRLPTLNELKLMYETIGQGASNDGEFSNGLYWSATPYDSYQARLLKFRNGNDSYHYNKAVESRRFLVRPVRDFSR